MAKKIKRGQYKSAPEVNRIFNDLEEYLDFCRMNLLKYDEADLYKSRNWHRFNDHKKRKAAWEAREKKRQAKQA